MRKTILLFSLAAIVFGGCKKSDNGPDLKARLMAHTWRLSALSIDGSVYALNPCAQDNTEVYADGYGYDDFGTNFCNGESAQRSNFTYTISGTTINANYGSQIATMNQVECTDVSLKYHQSLNDGNGVTHQVVSTWLAL